ncbi:MAG: PQQ-binding-like beta-propeller repeat protein [Chloroflexi bacterium]|nr:PQQ-binding-like beta-propeller repeat protein [Chloroflexota bacterium]MCL5074282.1 PQQ-binding-like beta-propeller repeat protein [Chloroflexota bacterium]
MGRLRARGRGWLSVGIILSILLSSGLLPYTVTPASEPLRALESSLASTPWPMFRHDLQHTGRSPYIGSPVPILKWVNVAGYYNALPPFSSSPTLGPDGTIYVGVTTPAQLVAVRPDGGTKWAFDISAGVYADVRSSAAVAADGTIYIGAQIDRASGMLYAINPDGTYKWGFWVPAWVRSSPSISADGSVYFGAGDGKLYALNPSGTLRWEFAAGGAISSSPAVGSDGTIYFGDARGVLYALSPDGSQRWSYPIGASITGSPAIGSDGTIYIGANDNYLYAIKSDGTLRWRFVTVSSIYSSPALASDGTIYIPSSTFLYALICSLPRRHAALEGKYRIRGALQPANGGGRWHHLSRQRGQRPLRPQS